jgi:NADPH-dependent 2,4-dienoyl-CoA reductase/sulfur reductase-like enzyme
MLGGTREFNGAIGTAVLGFEQMCVARTGETEASLVGKPQKAAHIYVHPGNHASYFPGAQKIHLKLSYDPLNGRILGAQAVGIVTLAMRL